MIRISPKAAKKALALREARAAADTVKFNMDTFLFKEQKEFVSDPARFATAVCSVRAGKTIACAADLINTALTMPRTTGLYITLARSSAKRIVWPELHKIITDYKIDAKFNEVELSVKFKNKSVIYCSGANNESEMDKLRGLSNVAVAYIDESQSFRSHIKELVEDVLIKRLYDLNGRLRLIGTPGPIPAGYFFDASRSPKWSHHKWTLHNNPWIEKKSGRTVAELIQQDCEQKGVAIDDPAIRREAFGEWVLDENSLLLQYSADKNHFEDLPLANYNYILGIDLGWNDSDSLSVIAWADNSPTTYLVEEILTERQLISALHGQISDLIKRYPICKMVVDAGGLGKKIVEDMKARYALPLEAADKTGKLANYALLNNALRTGTFKAKRTSQFAQDCNILEKNLDKSTSDRVVVRGHSDAVDSVLYAFRESPAYAFRTPPPAPKTGSEEWALAEVEKMRQMAYAMLKKAEEEAGLNDPFGGMDSGVDLSRWK